jgi:hypothetical protein
VTKAATAADVESFRDALFDPDPEAKITQLFLVQVGEIRDGLNGILLFGTDEVVAAARVFEELFGPAEHAIQAEAVLGALQSGDKTALRNLLDAWDNHARTTKWRQAIRALEAAMRDEVAPKP